MTSATEMSAEWKSTLERVKADDCRAASEDDLKSLMAAAEGFDQANDLISEERARHLLGTLESSIARYDPAISNLKRALVLSQALKDWRVERRVLADLGEALTHQGNSKDALGYLNRAVLQSHTAGDIASEAVALRLVAEAIYGNHPVEANKDLARSLTLSEQAKDLKNKAIILYDQADIWNDPTHPDGPIRLFHQALDIEGQIGDCRDKAETLADLGTVEEDQGNARDAIDATTEALKIERQLHDRDSEAKTLHILAKIHQDIGDLPEALSTFQEALKIEHDIGDSAAQGPTMLSISAVYRDMGKTHRALDGLLDTLAFVKNSNDLPSQVIALNYLGAVQADLGHPHEARSYYEASTQIAHKVPDRIFPAYNAWGIGELEDQDAVNNYLRALELAQEFDRVEFQGLVNASLMDHYKARHLPEVAIFWGKQAVDRFQALRKNMGGLGDALMSSFVQRKAETYRTLAGLLIEAGRLKEAQQVLDLLKIQQFSDYMGGGSSDLPKLTLACVPVETQLEAELDRRLSDIVTLRKRFDGRKQAATANTEIEGTPPSLQSAEDRLLAFTDQLKDKLQPTAIRDLRPDEENQPQIALGYLIARNPKTVVIYTVVEQDRFSIFVITSRRRFGRSVPILRDVLEQKCKRFLDELRHHQRDPTSTAQDLFGIVFGPVQKEVEDAVQKQVVNAPAGTLVWYLDGALRFIPVGALSDPKTGRFLIQDYNVVNYTPLARFQTDRPKLAAASGIAMGTSKQLDPDLPQLTYVPNELDEVIKDPQVSGSHGPLPGKILLDDKFTERAMKRSLRSQTVVHIASHFVLTPGNDSLSYLLLGGKDHGSGGFHLSLFDFKQDHDFRLDGTELVTLSACGTGAENKRDDGVVMEGMSEAVLDKKAKAVISTLWSVNDESTAAIMSRFYELWIGPGGKVTKAGALRKAELEMIEGRISSQSPESNRGLQVEGAVNKPRFSDPYYWAPFVLVGNWQ